MNKLLNTVDREIFTVKNFSPLGHEAKIKRTNISYAKKKLRENFPIYGSRILRK